MRARSIATFFAFALTTALGSSVAYAQSDLAEAETSYKGAVMLDGGVDATFDYAWEGLFNSWEFDQTEYAYWSGNTLYLGAEDEHGNGVDAIAEFFWFESSIDRGSDFYVAVIKARSTPKVTGDWELETGDDKPVQHVSATTDLSRGTGAFRWDWSVPFENYGIESYGQVNMKASYGMGIDAEGSAMTAAKYNENGVVAEGTVQAKGYVNADYSVKTNYTIELWSWYTTVRGAPGEQTWEVTCDNFTKTEESAYHEYFLVMQSEAGVPFTIDTLTIGGSFDEFNWGFGDTNQFSVEVAGITLSRPPVASDDEPVDPPADDPTEDEPVDPPADDEEEESTDEESWDEVDEYYDGRDDLEESGDAPAEARGCSTVPVEGMVGAWMLLPLALLGLRRRD